jgi:hypothetical protein
MAWETKNNSGSLFRNNRKEQPNHPDHTGTALIDGVEYFINAWVKEGKNGKYFSFSFRPKNPPAEKARPDESSAAAFIDDQIPF